MITSYFKAKKQTGLRESSANDESVSGKKHDLNSENASNVKENTRNDNKRFKHNGSSSIVANSENKSENVLAPEAEELMSYLNEESWRMKIANHVSKHSFLKLAKFVIAERASKTIYPQPCDVFSALNSVPIDKVKVVIVGQDPYHQPNQGHGLAFSVRKGIQIPPSLRNIYKELLNNENCGFDKIPTHGNLEQWCKQGVLLLNTVLTVRKNEANSHANQGWEYFTDEIIRILVSDKRKKLVFLLWGKPASKKAENIITKYGGKGRHTIITTSHPSPLGATKTNSPFIGSKCFSRANDALVKMGENPIDWKID